MIELERIEDLCARLGLGTMASHLAMVADEAARKNLSFHEFFERLLYAEHRERWSSPPFGPDTRHDLRA